MNQTQSKDLHNRKKKDRTAENSFCSKAQKPAELQLDQNTSQVEGFKNRRSDLFFADMFENDDT